MKTLKVTKIFYGLQGEGLKAGYPFSFIRLAECNLRCAYCDTPEAFERGEERTMDEVVDEVDKLNCKRVLITGGEPLVQQDTLPLIERLLEEGFDVYLETNGSLDIELVPKGCHILMDIKCPGSGEEENNRLDNLLYMKSGDEIKFVIRDRADYEWARDFCKGRGLFLRDRNIHFSPSHDELEPRMLAGWMLEDGVDARLHLQLHKLVWGPGGQ